MNGMEKKVRRGGGRISNTLKEPTNERTKEAAKNKPYITTHKENQ
jgi:hypothetical protein